MARYKYKKVTASGYERTYKNSIKNDWKMYEISAILWRIFTLKKVPKIYESDVARTTKAKKVLNPPFRTAGPIFCRAVIDRSVRDPTGRKIISYYEQKKQ